MGEKHLVDELGLVLEPGPVPDLMVAQDMLQDHQFNHLLGFGVREFALGDDGGNAGIQGMDNLLGDLVDI